MAGVQTATILEEVLDFLASAPTPQQILDHQVSETAQTRMRHLLDHNRNGTLSVEETEELDKLEHTYQFMLILKAKTRLRLMESAGSNTLEEVLNFLVSSPTLEEITKFQASEIVQERMGYLLDKNRNSRLTDAEVAELDEMGLLDHIVTLLKARAHKKLMKPL